MQVQGTANSPACSENCSDDLDMTSYNFYSRGLITSTLELNVMEVKSNLILVFL